MTEDGRQTVASTETGGNGDRPKAGDRLAPDVKVLIAMGSLLALLAVAIILAVALVVGLYGDTEHLTDRDMQYATAINVAALNAKGIANDERGFLLSGRRVFIRELDERTGNARSAFAVARDQADSKEQRQAVDEAHAGFERWIEALHRETATFQAGKREEAIAASLGRTRALRKSYERSLATAQELGSDAIESASSSVSAASKRSIAILLAYLVAALAMGLVLTLWVARTVLRPLRTLLHLVGEGQRVRIRS